MSRVVVLARTGAHRCAHPSGEPAEYTEDPASCACAHGFGRPALDDRFSDVRGDLLVAVELHREAGAALRGRADVGGVAEHLAERDVGVDRDRVSARLLALHLAAA